MKTHYATVSANGQITIPAEVRRELGIEPGSRIAITLNDDGMRVSRPLKTVADVAGILKPLHPVSEDFDDEIEEAMADWYAEEYPESVRR
jgi:antitoxin PrlF